MSSVTNRYPEPGATGVSPRVHPVFEITDLSDKSLINVWIEGAKVVEDGSPAPGNHVEDNDLGGFRVTIAYPLPDLETVSLRAVAGAMDETWSFETADSHGPFVASASPPLGSISTTSPTAISLRIADAGTTVDVNTLQLYIDGVQMVEDGADISPGGWAVAIIDTGELDITITVPGSNWSAGDTARLGIEVADANGNVSVINGTFDVVDTRGPQVTNQVPADGSRGLGLTEDLIFDITSSEGVEFGSINIEVNGISAIAMGIGQGDWSTSTVVGITDGWRITLKKPSGYTDGEMVFVDIQTANTPSGYVNERRILRYHFGTTTGNQTVNHGLGGIVVRVLAYDLTGTSFADPVAMGHTGFAWDGVWYENGSPTGTRASWHDDLGDFPISGHIVVTDTGWAIVEPLADSAWMTCTTQTAPNWSMAGTGTINDAEFGPDPVLFVASDVIVEVDFALDRARVYDDSGRDTGTTDIKHRNDAQVGTTVEEQFALPAGPYTHFAARRERRSTFMAVASAGALSVLHDLDTAWLQELATGAVPAAVVTRSLAEWTSATWVRLRLESEFMALAYNDTEAQVEFWHWFTFLEGGDRELFLDPGTTPALPTGTVKDLDMVYPFLTVGMETEVDVIDVTGPTLTNYMSLSLTGNLVAVAMQRGAEAIYAADATRVVRLTLHSAVADIVADGVSVSNLSAIGSTRHNVDEYVHTQMEIA